MNIDKNIGFECKRCGKCCDFFILGFNIGISRKDLSSWKKEGRKDILELFEISRDWFGDVEIYPSLLRFNRWPFLLKIKDMYTCTIHDLKPEGCRSFPFYNDGTIHPWADKNCSGLKTRNQIVVNGKI